MGGSPTRFESRAADWLSAPEALRRILDAAIPGASETVPTSEALGRALAEDLTATATLPPWDNAAMDGYAVRSADIRGAAPGNPVVLTVVGAIHAGAPPAVAVDAGHAVRIMTGAPVPPGADTVVRVEDTDAEADTGSVRILDHRDARRNVRPAGQDMALGDRMLSPGDPIHAGTVGVLYAMGRDRVSCTRRPVVAILSTGNELRGPDRYEDVQSGLAVPESNGPMLAAAVAAAGCVPRYLGVAADEPGDIRRRLEDARDADVVITVGGASMGEADLVKRVLDQMSFELDFWRARVRPGSPVSFGHLPGGEDSPSQPVFGLPGNPASSFVTFELFVRPFLRRVAGHARPHRPVVPCVAGERLHAPPGKLYALRVRVDATASPPRAIPTGPQSSGLVQSMAIADGLALVAEDADGVDVGEPVDVMLLDGGNFRRDAPRLLSAP